MPSRHHETDTTNAAIASSATTSRLEPSVGGLPLKRAIAALSAIILLAPALAYVSGRRGAPIENRAPVEFSGLESGWSSFTDFGQYVDDRLPLRARAIWADAWIDRHVFGEDPAFGGGSSPRVIEGKEGLLFLADALYNACQPNAPAAETARNLDRLATIISDSGREMLTMIAPDKSTILPELLPDGFDRGCLDNYIGTLWAELNGASIPGFVDLRDALRKSAADTREYLYLRKDSHWDQAGSLVAVEAMVEHFAPGLWRDSEVSYRGLYDYTGDLTSFRGAPEVDQAPNYVIVRPDITPVSAEPIDDIEGEPNKRYINAGPEGRLIPGRTVMFLDSYGFAALSQIIPYFEDLTVMRLYDFDPTRYVELITSADRVWFMSVERSAAWRLSYEVGSPAFLDQLEADLPKRDGS